MNEKIYSTPKFTIFSNKKLPGIQRGMKIQPLNKRKIQSKPKTQTNGR